MEALLGFPLSLAFALIPIYLYRPEFNRRLWLSGVLIVTAAFFFLPWRLRIEAFMPGGAAIFFLISGIWVVALNPTSSIFKLLNMPLPSRKELKAEIEKRKVKAAGMDLGLDDEEPADKEIDPRLDRVAKKLKARTSEQDHFLDGYLAGLGLDSGWLIVFDQRTALPPIEERTTSETTTSPGGRMITVICA